MNINKLITSLFGNKAMRDMKEIQPVVEKVKVEYERIKGLDNDQLRAESARIRQYIKDCIAGDEQTIAGLRAEAANASVETTERVYKQIDAIEKTILEKIEKALDEVLPVAFSLVKETARRFKENERVVVTANDFDRNLAARKSNVIIEGDKAVWLNHWMAGGNEIVWDMVHYDVQLFGGVVLHQGKIAEMATGEGKTLVATLPVFLNALSGRGVHVVTVNDYLAKRDSEWMGPIYEFHGLSVDCIDKHQPSSADRRKAYLADITFGTNNEFGFDYLRDNSGIASSPEDLVQRQHHYAIVDEVDSVLIDDARTPLIISGPVPRGDNQLFDDYRPRVEQLVEEQRRLVSQILAEAKALIAKNDTEQGGLLLLRAFKGLPKNKPLIKFLSEQGIKQLLLKTEGFYMQENSKNMHIATDPLYFIIDEQSNAVELTDKGIECLTGKSEDPDFFVLPDIGSEVADLEKSDLSPEVLAEKKAEMVQNYTIKSERVHTVNQLLKAYTLFERDDEYVVVDNKVMIVDEQTGRIMEGRRYSDGLHQAIEAKERVKVEAATQTFATITLQNYFRMYHKLAGMTGTAETEAGEFWNIYKLDVVVIPTNRPVIREDHADIVYKTKREKYNAIIAEIVRLVKEGRPVLVGTTSVEISELLSRMLNMRHIPHNVLNAKLHQREAEIVAEAGRAGTVTIATNMAGRGTDIKLTESVREAGGLAIIGTERHESRRVDRQLRGRSGRQGDPGSSQFYVSFEDDLLRLFGSDRMASVVDKLGIAEGEMIQSDMLTKSIERAQKKVEENNFGIRKHLLEYDDVMNSQREVIYTKRRNVLFGEKVNVEIANMMNDLIETLVQTHQESGSFDDLKLDLLRYFSIDCPFSAVQLKSGRLPELTEAIYKAARAAYERKCDDMRTRVMPVIRDVFEKQGAVYTTISIPITDGKRVFQIIVNLQRACETDGLEIVRTFEKLVMLHTIDEAWKEHLRELDDLRQSVRNATYEQKDPLLIYKFESFDLFKGMLERINKDVVSLLMKGRIPIQESNEVRQAAPQRRVDTSHMQARKSEYSRPSMPARSGDGAPQTPQKQEEQHVQTVVRGEKKIGRNDPCPCGSGKKYKNCHGRNLTE